MNMLYWVRNQSHTVKKLVVNRVGEIQSASQPKQ